jgi:anaerobic magnesium-protoporphyrin IX monomethyl ester cyclase
MRATLIFPPATDPRAPHLALPYLAAVLRRAGISTRLIDADIGSLIALLRPDAISRNVRKLKLRPPADIEASALSRLLLRGEALVEEMPHAFATLRDKEKFYDVHRFHVARNALLDGTDLASIASDRPIRYSLCPIQYDIDGVDEQRLADLIAATADRRNNLFEDYWETELLPSIEADSPDLIGISIVNRQQLLPGLALARRLRMRGLFVVLGGTVFTKFVSQLMRLPAFFEHFADGVIVYEGETAILELVAQLASERDFSRVPNYLYAESGRVHSGKTHVEDVDELPAPDFEGLPLHDYLAPEIVLPILVGKGCYFNECKFCDIPFINHVSKKPYRVRSPQKIARDILELNDRFGCRHFEITDEALPPRLLEKLADELEPFGDRRLSFTGYARLEPGFTEGLCGKLAKMGMRKLYFGLESGDQATLDHMKKGIRLKDVRPVLTHCREAGILFHIFSIVGFPEETEASARNTLRFFEDNIDIIDHPGNTFDIHPFGLELRTNYFANAGRLGLNIPADALEKEFVIGVKAGWSNTRGLTNAEAARLVAEYNDALRDIYCRFHNSQMHLWPGFEEYAVLYADYYATRDFSFRTALPDRREAPRFMIDWCPDAAIEADRDSRRMTSRWKTVAVTESTYRVLGSPRWRTLEEFMAECLALNLVGTRDAAESKIRSAINELIGGRLLQLVVETDKPGTPAAADLDTKASKMATIG